MKNKRALFLIVFILSCTFIGCQAGSLHIKPGHVILKGKIANYKGIFRTGKLTWFDAVTRTVNDKIFEIDGAGNFDVGFDLVHPITGSIMLDLENNFYDGFLIEPGKSYQVVIRDQEMDFPGDVGLINRHLDRFNHSMDSVLGSEIDEGNKLHDKGLAIEEYISKMRQLEIKRQRFLASYLRTVPMPDKAIKALESEIRYKTAHAWINYRFDYSTGRPILRDSLPDSFYIELLHDYPVNSEDDIQSRNCIDYISNLAKVFEERGANLDSRIAFYRAAGFFSDRELDLIRQVYSGNREVVKSEEYKQFVNPANSDRLNALTYRYRISTILANASELAPGLGRDLMLSQSVSKNYFENNMVPSDKEWERISQLITDRSVFTYLKAFSINQTSQKVENKPDVDQVKMSLDQIKGKFIDKYKGKVIYIDFFATWCGPCRIEIPYAKTLQYEFRDKEVVFLNLCCQSKPEDWENMIKQKGIEGENYLISREEFNLLSRLYKVKGFPTYILIDQQGIVQDYEAPRPSSKQEIIAKINRLL